MSFRAPCALSTRQSTVKILGQNLRPRQAAVERGSYCPDQKTLGDDSRINSGSQAPSRFLDHLLLFCAEVQNFGQAAFPERAIWLIAHRIDRNRTRFLE